MAKNVSVYFTSENDVESAQTSLQSLKISDIYIEEMPEDTDTDMFIPLFASNISTSGSASNLGISGTAAPFIPEITEEDEDVGNESSGRITHLLHFEVEEEDYDEAIAILKAFECYGTNE